ncbi:hypothetical protein, partial [Candidatus Liberibacter solanacearum]|uniref:hypothetical protein n=2 Tax=Candidatus Liberibacter solanacearum TaxID=556287 RepID=UPI00387DCE12
EPYHLLVACLPIDNTAGILGSSVSAGLGKYYSRDFNNSYFFKNVGLDVMVNIGIENLEHGIMFTSAISHHILSFY